ncbi:uncharacterized protein LOC128387302 isoform X2 [Panonychus citri]|uniref:uncharacterized protein LOC128387302 isoform X2 n=1 Tax=Panonychus citri TaxID=50023 RepID=UPI002307794D|nr:uncharacterized protein LOC128387302 isoform X2 [Panonychus citri]
MLACKKGNHFKRKYNKNDTKIWSELQLFKKYKFNDDYLDPREYIGFKGIVEKRPTFFAAFISLVNKVIPAEEYQIKFEGSLTARCVKNSSLAICKSENSIEIVIDFRKTFSTYGLEDFQYVIALNTSFDFPDILTFATLNSNGKIKTVKKFNSSCKNRYYFINVDNCTNLESPLHKLASALCDPQKMFEETLRSKEIGSIKPCLSTKNCWMLLIEAQICHIKESQDELDQMVSLGRYYFKVIS